MHFQNLPTEPTFESVRERITETRDFLRQAVKRGMIYDGRSKDDTAREVAMLSRLVTTTATTVGNDGKPPSLTRQTSLMNLYKTVLNFCGDGNKLIIDLPKEELAKMLLQIENFEVNFRPGSQPSKWVPDRHERDKFTVHTATTAFQGLTAEEAGALILSNSNAELHDERTRFKDNHIDGGSLTLEIPKSEALGNEGNVNQDQWAHTLADPETVVVIYSQLLARMSAPNYPTSKTEESFFEHISGNCFTRCRGNTAVEVIRDGEEVSMRIRDGIDPRISGLSAIVC